MGSKYFRLLRFAACLLLTGCSNFNITRNPAAFAPTVQLATIDDPSFTAGKNILTGFDEPRGDVAWRADDWVLLGVKVTHPDETSVWFVRLSTLPDKADQPTPPGGREFTVPFAVGNVRSGAKFTAPTARVLIETFDREGTLLRSSVRSVPQMNRSANLFDVLMEMRAQIASDSAQDQDVPRMSNDNLAGLMVMLQSMGCSRAIAPIREAVRRDVVRTPTVLGILLGGLRLKVEADITETELVGSPWSSDAALAPRREAQFPVAISGQKLFDCRMVVGPSNPPYNLLGGALLFEAAHPEKPDNRLTVRVLAAKCMSGAERQSLPAVASR